MTTHVPRDESAVLHPAIQAKIEAMQKARRQELAELKGGALGFAQSQVALQAENEAYLDNVVANVNEVFIRRERYLNNVPIALIAFIPWLLHLGIALMWLIVGLLEGRWVVGVTLYQVIIVCTLILHGMIHFSIGFKGLWHELCRHKWAWLIGLCFTLVTVKVLTANDWVTHDDVCDDCSNHRIDF